MKTNQVMIRDNKSFIQRTSDKYFNANALLNSWNTANPENRKEIGKYKLNKSTKEFIGELIAEGVENPIISSNKGTWMHPKLFIDFAMWTSIKFKSIVIDYVLDGLIASRHDAGDYFNQMKAVILETHVNYCGTRPNPSLYISEAKRIKHLLGLDRKDRNEMTEKELGAITQLQKLNSLLLTERVGKNARIRQLKLQARLLNM